MNWGYAILLVVVALMAFAGGYVYTVVYVYRRFHQVIAHASPEERRMLNRLMDSITGPPRWHDGAIRSSDGD